MSLRKLMMRTFGIGIVVAVTALLSCSGVMEFAQASLPSEERTNGKLVRAAFSEQRDVLQKSSAVIYDGWRNVGYGIVVAKDGYILAKGSELDGRENISIRVDNLKFTNVKIVARNPRWDVALLKVDASDLQPIKWASSVELPQGAWVVANGVTSRSLRRVNIGIVSAKSRALEGRAPAVMGLSFKSKADSMEIQIVTPETGAERSGLKPGDVLKMFAGEKVLSRSELIERVRDFVPGDFVPIEYERAGKTYKTEIELMARSDAYQEEQSRNDSMSGDVSKRRDSFPRVMQTDIRFSARNIGGPLLNLDGECVGMNIARANRAESFAIPVKELREVLEQLLNDAE